MQIYPGWDVLEPGEIDTFGFEFIDDLASESIVSTSWSASLVNPLDASDPNPQNILTGPPFVQGTQSWQKITGGVDGAVYRVEAAVTTSSGRTLKNWALLPCTSS